MLHNVKDLSNTKVYTIETKIKNYRQYAGIDIRILEADNKHVNVNISQIKRIGKTLNKPQLEAKAKAIFKNLPSQCSLSISAKLLL